MKNDLLPSKSHIILACAGATTFPLIILLCAVNGEVTWSNEIPSWAVVGLAAGLLIGWLELAIMRRSTVKACNIIIDSTTIALFALLPIGLVLSLFGVISNPWTWFAL